ncbi:MAG: Gfo/Idh/MocA family oxidoreductase [Bacteroidota bacterium]|nr:Gfo/Idh/MocA family oxidoreductase [Bacteroidota bacterium]
MIRTGIIGLGKMGISHCAILGAHPDVDLVSVCDSSSLVLEGFKKYSRFECFNDYRKMIADMNLDALVIATPTKFHAEMVSHALNNNVHVFCEKPFSLNAEEGRQLTALAKRNNLVNQVGYHNRFIATFMEVKRILELNVLGDLYHFVGESYGPVVLKEKAGTWRSEKGQGGGCLYDYASHTIDLIHFVLARPVKVSGTQLKFIFSKDVEDAVYSNLTLETGLGGHLSVNWSDDTHRKMATQITVLGKKGKIIADATELKIYLKEDNKALGLTRGWTVKNIVDLSDIANFNLRGEEYSFQLDHFIHAVKTKNITNRSSFESALVTDELINQLIGDNSNN